MLVVNELLRYAPSDDKLLAIPPIINCADPFLLFCLQIANQDPNRNNFLVGKNLLSFSQYVNQILSRLYAACQFIIENHDKQKVSDLSQSKIDFELHTESCVLHEYQYSLREFILMLKIIVDQFIILLPLDLKNGKNCGSIGKFLEGIKKTKTTFWDDYKKFLIGLNVAANYLKHHPYQFEEPSRMLHLIPPSLLVIVKNNDKSQDCCSLKESFTNQLQYSGNNHHVLCLISCDFLVSGFNAFYKKLNAQMKADNTD